MDIRDRISKSEADKIKVRVAQEYKKKLNEWTASPEQDTDTDQLVKRFEDQFVEDFWHAFKPPPNILFRVFDALKLPRLFQIILHILTNVRRLTRPEMAAASSLLGATAIRYRAVRVAEGGLLKVIFKLNRNRAFSQFHTICLPAYGWHSGSHFDIVLHELIHVYQFEVVGSIYIFQTLMTQRTQGYVYGGWHQLEEDWKNGKHFRDYNREQQAQIAQDYYNMVIRDELLAEDPVSQAYEPFIKELRNGEL